MERQFSCTFCFEYNLDEIELLLRTALEVLGFEKKLMYIIVNYDELFENIPFDYEILFSSLKKGASMIKIRNNLFDEEGNNFWFKLEISKAYKLFELTWHNNNLAFLLESKYIINFLKSEKLVCGSCYDSSDKFDQSREKIEYFTNPDPKNPHKVEKIEEVIDISNHWGRSVSVCGIQFIAAPIMWFGEKYYGIIPKQKLLEFKYAESIKLPFVDIVSIKMFDLYDSPDKPDNRSKQKEYWIFLDLIRVIEDYKRKNELDPTHSIQELISETIKRRKH
jgi:hypothetical protein